MFVEKTPNEPLVDALKRGEEWAYRLLVHREQDRIFNVCCRYIGNAEDAKDAAQETFIRVIRSIRQFRGESSLRTWLYRITINVCKNFVRDRSRAGYDREEPLDALQDESGMARATVVANPNPGPDELASGNELEEALSQSVAGLAEHYRAAFILRHQEGLTYEEIAQALDIPTGTVRSRLSEARQQLRKKLAPWLNEARGQPSKAGRSSAGTR